ncbi:MAG TPA: 3-dehydroquinate synthase [Candidatus Eisenbacteria bacterium]
MTRVRVPLPGKRYDILVGAGVRTGAARSIAAAVAARRLLIVADARAWDRHGPPLLENLRGTFDLSVVTIPPGESSKTLRRAERLFEACRDHRLGRDGAILAFGGGMVGDLAGFVAATWQRGVDLVMMPTTLLAQVDSSVGGKVAVNVGGIKNLVGAFHQPRLVLADTDWLATLSPRERRSGLAEVVKYGMIADRRLFERLERAGAGLMKASAEELANVVVGCVRIKSAIVARDEKDEGRRLLLNYGHTIGHAFEAAAAGGLRHGEAVALGMRGAARLAEGIGWLDSASRRRQDELLDALGLPNRFSGASPRELEAKILQDKKVQDRKPRFVLTRSIGSASVAPPIDASRVRRVLADLTSS